MRTTYLLTLQSLSSLYSTDTVIFSVMEHASEECWQCTKCTMLNAEARAEKIQKLFQILTTIDAENAKLPVQASQWAG